jgi:hypothetical protein
MLNRTVTVDESWMHHCQPESLGVSMQWKHPNSRSSAKKFKVTPSAGKVMSTVCWHFLKRGETVNSVEA